MQLRVRESKRGREGESARLSVCVAVFTPINELVYMPAEVMMCCLWWSPLQPTTPTTQIPPSPSTTEALHPPQTR